MGDELISTMLGFGSVIRPYLNHQIAEVLSGHGLTERDLQVLEFVNSRTSPSFAQVTEHVQAWHAPGTSTSRLSATISVLFAEHGVIRKEINPVDQRQPLILLTPKGKRILEEVAGVRAQVMKEIRASMELGPAEEKALKNVFTRGTANFMDLLAKRKKSRPDGP